MSRPQLTATYRVQMNAGFTFAMARDRVEYFSRLGVSHLYLSPILAARRGSMHGYDVVDPTKLNPELGTEADLRALAQSLRAHDMGILLDIVPNHMGIGPENPYWDDVLTHGERSRYARWFDIDWSHSNGKPAKVVLPVLGEELDRVIERGGITIHVGDTHTPRLVYESLSFPIDPASLPPELQLAQFDPPETGELADDYSRPEGRERLRALLDAQHYRLVFWRRGTREINYRRFFDVNDLAAIRVEDPAVFEESHAFILGLVRDRVIDALRVDHIDGLLNPTAYLTRLRTSVGDDVPIVVEKILALGEEIPASWPVQGTTGYEFMNDVDDLFVDPSGFADIERYYRGLRRLGATTFKDIARAGKEAALAGALKADVERITTLLARVARDAKKPWTRAELATALVEFMSALPVYRTELAPRAPMEPSDREIIEQTSQEAPPPDSSGTINAFIADVLMAAAGASESDPRLQFALRMQQVSGPATAKGVEDTALYVYVPLASRNEVGGAPDRPLSDAVGRFHAANARRAERSPLGLITTNTHDAKRSGDVRSRLAALSEISHDWKRAVHRWRRLTGRHRQTVKGRLAPDTNTEYLLYQTLVAVFPPPRFGRRSDDLPDRAWRDSARGRLVEYMRKAAREAKVRTSWIEPDADFENAVASFITAVLEPSEDAPLLPDIARLVSRIAPTGANNTLARLVLHLTSPGTPDIYQGDEFWNFALVDPDNRRPVDYDARRRALDDLSSVERKLSGDAPIDLFDNRLKMLVTHRLLELRRTRADVFARGGYCPLMARGSRGEHVVAFMRAFGERQVITIAARLTSGLAVGDSTEWWGDTAIDIPVELGATTWTSVMTGEKTAATHATIRVAEVLSKLPGAVLTN